MAWNKLGLFAILLCGLLFYGALSFGLPKKGDIKMLEPAEGQNVIYFAGGCFWGVQEYYSRIPGVVETISGYAQSQVPDPSYDMVCSGKTGAAETVRVLYNAGQVDLQILVRQFFKIINPYTANRQGNDVGSQYRPGIFYTNAADRPVIENVIASLQKQSERPFVVEVEKLQNFYPAERYHQDYLKKNPGGYCHIDFSSLKDLETKNDRPQKFARPSQKELEARLTPIEYHVTQEAGTEPPYTGKYWKHDEPGIYVDIASGEPLFSSSQKFDSGCGWPSFARPLAPDAVVEKRDLSHGMDRVEVRSSNADSHLGHVFTDGPKALGGLRYCINSAALRFVPYDKMDEEGYGQYKKFVKPEKD